MSIETLSEHPIILQITKDLKNIGVNKDTILMIQSQMRLWHDENDRMKERIQTLKSYQLTPEQRDILTALADQVLGLIE